MIDLARSSYYYEPKRPLEEREKDDLLLKDLIEIIHKDFPGYGYRRIAAHLKRQGTIVNHKRIRRVMEKYGLYPICWRKFTCKTTDSDHNLRIYPNLLKDISVTDINQVWVSDLTYIRIKNCFVYLAVILDLYSRKVIGWSLSRSLDREVCVQALATAIEARNPPPGCIHHSDRGVQYASHDYIHLLISAGLKPSMSAKGYAYDNAFAESFFKTLKYEEVHLSDYETFDDVISSVPNFIEAVYNRKRLHSSLGYLPPEEFEMNRKRSLTADHPVLNL